MPCRHEVLRAMSDTLMLRHSGAYFALFCHGPYATPVTVTYTLRERYHMPADTIYKSVIYDVLSCHASYASDNIIERYAYH